MALTACSIFRSHIKDGMSKLGITTTQNVRIDYVKASVMHRLGARAIDTGVIITMVFAYIYLIDSIDYYNTTANWMFVWLIILYPLMTEVFFSGQTVGKMALKIYVVRDDGSPATIGGFFMRWLIGMVETTGPFFVIAFFSILLSKKGQRLGDMAAGTVVVQRAPRVTLDELLLSARVTEEPEIPQAVMLNERDVETIRQVLTVPMSKIDDDKATDLVWKTAEILAKRLGTGEILNAEEYLESLLSSYQTIHRA